MEEKNPNQMCAVSDLLLLGDSEHFHKEDHLLLEGQVLVVGSSEKAAYAPEWCEEVAGFQE